MLMICEVIARFDVLTEILNIFTKCFSIKNKNVDMDSIIGMRCSVVEKIDNYAGCGLIKVNGQYWAARSASDEDTFEIGEVLNIVAIEGVKVICRK